MFILLRPISVVLVAFGALALSWICIAQDHSVEPDWEKKRDKQGIAVFTGDVEGSPYKAVRAEMTVQSSVATLVALLNDLDRCSDWIDLCRESRIVQRISDDQAYVYAYNDIPFPVKDRDVVGLMQWSTEPDSGRVTMRSKALDMPDSIELEPANPAAVRITEAVTEWRFTPLGNGSTQVENYTHANPNGPIPAWFFNFVVMRSPYKSMLSMRRLVESGAYQTDEVDADASLLPAR